MGTTTDCIYVEIYGGVFRTPNLGEVGALNGTATSVTIPAGTPPGLALPLTLKVGGQQSNSVLVALQ